MPGPTTPPPSLLFPQSCWSQLEESSIVSVTQSFSHVARGHICKGCGSSSRLESWWIWVWILTAELASSVTLDKSLQQPFWAQPHHLWSEGHIILFRGCLGDLSKVMYHVVKCLAQGSQVLKLQKSNFSSWNTTSWKSEITAYEEFLSGIFLHFLNPSLCSSVLPSTSSASSHSARPHTSFVSKIPICSFVVYCA